MKRSRRVAILIWLSLALPAPGTLFAQGPPSHRGGPPGNPEQREKIRENIETLRMYKLLEALDLSSEQSTEFLPAMKEFQEAKRSFQEERRNLLRELEAALESEVNNRAKLDQTLAALENTREEFQAEFAKFLTKARSILTLEQRARLHLFEERFERRLRESIRQMRGKEHRTDESR